MNSKFRNSVIVGTALIIYLVLSTIFIISIHLFWKSNIYPMLRSHFLCGLFGMLGASVSTIRKYYQSLITEKNFELQKKEFVPLDWSYVWIYYYLTRPIVGSILGALLYTLTYTGIFLLSDKQDIIISIKGKYLLLAISFLTGFSASHALDRLEVVSKEIFKSKI